MRACLLGVPGAGKSTCIRWVKELLTQGFDYQDGVHYQCLAPQNTMAALIGGSTLHSWGAIPMNATAAREQAASRKGALDADVLFERTASMRWLIIDEISNVALYVLG